MFFFRDLGDDLWKNLKQKLLWYYPKGKYFTLNSTIIILGTKSSESKKIQQLVHIRSAKFREQLAWYSPLYVRRILWSALHIILLFSNVYSKRGKFGTLFRVKFIFGSVLLRVRIWAVEIYFSCVVQKACIRMYPVQYIAYHICTRTSYTIPIEENNNQLITSCQLKTELSRVSLQVQLLDVTDNIEMKSRDSLNLSIYQSIRRI